MVYSSSKKNEEANKPSPREYNPRWKGYTFILLSSLINFSAISNVERDDDYEGRWGASLSFGIVVFVFSFLVLFTDRAPFRWVDDFNIYSKAWEGKFEGFCLLVLTLYSIIAVAYMTQVRGIAYLALNIYFSAWLMLAACVYTLNKWSASKDILTIAEMTGVSATLKSWYIVLLGSLIVMGTSINMMIVIAGNSDREVLENEGAAAFGIAFGFFSSVLSIGFILVHYNFIECITEGGWIELFCIVVVVLMWIVGVAVLTQDSSIASTVIGSGCQRFTEPPPDSKLVTIIKEELVAANESKMIPDCTLIIRNVTYFCDILLDVNEGQEKSETAIPGSNLYLSVWTCLFGSLNLASRWKAQQALQFAQAQQEKAFKTAQMREGKGKEDIGEDADDDDDLDDFEDADDY